MMKSTLPIKASHASYLRHRRQTWAQIILPIVLGGVVMVGLAALAGMSALGGTADLGRWAAISTIWLVFPLLAFGMLLLLLVAAVTYVVALVKKLIPPYSSQIQRVFFRLESGVKSAAQAAAQPIMLLRQITARAKGLLGRG